MRREVSLLGLVSLVGCFNDVDVGEVASDQPCVVSGELNEGPPYGAIVNGFLTTEEQCPSWLREDHQESVILFTGRAWGPEGSECRARDPWYLNNGMNYAATIPAQALDLIGNGSVISTWDQEKLRPPRALGYCAINEGTPEEYLVYSTCGISNVAVGACEATLPAAARKNAGVTITAKWHPCPNPDDDRCLREPVRHECLPDLDLIDGASHAVYLDTPYWACSDPSSLEGFDSLLVTINPGWGDDVQCIGAQAWSAVDTTEKNIDVHPRSYAGMLKPGCSPKSFVHKDSRGTVSPLPAPNRAPTGYCDIWAGTPYRYVVFSFCETGDALSPESLCQNAWQTQAGAFPTWHACPGSEFCFEPSDPDC